MYNKGKTLRWCMALLGCWMLLLGAGAGAQGNNLTLSSPTYNSSGKFGASLNGGTGTAPVGVLAAPASGTHIATVELWVRVANNGSTNVALSKPGVFWFGHNNNGQPALHYGPSASETVITGAASICDSTWHHIEMDFGTTVFLCVDGTPVVSGAANLGANGNALGVRTLTGVQGFDWNGEVDEIALWSVQKHTAAFTPPAAAYTGAESALLALWHLDNNGTDSTVSNAATAFTLTGPTGGNAGVASSVFTVAPNGALGQPETITLSASSAGGTFTPATLGFANGATAGQTVTYTPSNAQANTSVTITATPSPALGTAPTVSYAVGPVLIYTRVDATDPLSGSAIMLLIPNSNATTPYNSANPTRLILYFHGAGEDQQALLTDPNKAGCVTALLNAGYILAASTGTSTTNWGNQPSVDAYLGCWKYVTTNYNISKTLFWGQSMGGIASLLALAENNIPNVVGWLGTYPVCSLANLYALGTYAGQINSAFGISGSGTATYANLTTGHDPVLKWGWAYRRVPMQIYASYGDTVVPRAQNTDALSTLVTGSAPIAVITCTGDHGDPSHFQPANYLTFANNCFANPPATSGSGGGTKRRAQ